MDYFTLQEVVSQTGLSEHTLRYYEKIGLIEDIQRDVTSGHRRYTAKDIHFIGLMACLRATGMSIDHMKKFLELTKQGRKGAVELADLFESHRQQLEIEIQKKQEHLRYLELKVEFWTAFSRNDTERMHEISLITSALAKHITE